MEIDPIQYKVAIQLSNEDPAVHKSVVKQIQNILNDLENVAIELLVHGPGIQLIEKNSKLGNTLAALQNKNVTIIGCQNTLNERHLDAQDLLPFVVIVPSALSHLIKRQHKGWSYIKAGF